MTYGVEILHTPYSCWCELSNSNSIGGYYVKSVGRWRAARIPPMISITIDKVRSQLLGHISCQHSLLSYWPSYLGTRGD